VIALAERHLADVAEQIEKLHSFKQELNRAVKAWKGAGKQTIAAGAICTLIEKTMETKRSNQQNK
jgi:hypothetical protein